MEMIKRIIDGFFRDMWSVRLVNVIIGMAAVIEAMPQGHWAWSVVIMIMPLPVLVWLYHGVLLALHPERVLEAGRREWMALAVVMVAVIAAVLIF